MVAAVRVVLVACLLSLVYANSSDRTKANGLDKITVTITRAKLEKKYVIRNVQANWYKASQMCLAEGKRLATITSEEENTLMKKTFKDINMPIPSNIWISLTDQAEEGSFVWMSTGEPVGYTNWIHLGVLGQQPDDTNKQEDCAHIWYHESNHLERLAWNDEPCWSKLHGFVCEYFEEV